MIALLTLSSLAQADEAPARVVLPYADFKVLYEKARVEDPKPEKAPRNYAINKATYTGNVVDNGESALFNVKMTVQVLKSDGWVAIPLAPTSVALRSAKVGGVDAPVVLDGGWYTLITDKKGTLPIELEVAVSVFESSGLSSFSFPMASSGGTEVSLVVPGKDDLEFQVSGAQFLVDEQKGENRVMTAILPAAGTLAVSWQREIKKEGDPGAPAAPEQQRRLYAEVHSLFGVSEGVLVGHSDVNYTIVHQGLETITLSLPADVALLDVQGQGIREWTTVKNGAVQNLKIDLNFKAEGAYRLMLDYEKAIGEGSVQAQLPVLDVAGVERVKGYVGVAALSTLEVVAGEPTGARRIDVQELPASILGRIDQPVLLGFKYRQGEWTIPLSVNQHQDIEVLVTIADMAEATTMMTADGRLMTRAAWHVRNNRRQFLRIEMPEGAEIWGVKVAGKAVQPAKDEKGTVLVPLVRSRSAGSSLAAFTVEVTYVQDGPGPDGSGKGAVDLTLPKVDVPVTYYRWSVYVPWNAKIKDKSVESTFRRVEYFSNPVTPEGEYLGQAAQAEMQQSYQAQQAASDSGVAPVEVSMPIDGQPVYFEKLLVLDEELTVHMDYKGLKDKK